MDSFYWISLIVCWLFAGFIYLARPEPSRDDVTVPIIVALSFIPALNAIMAIGIVLLFLGLLIGRKA